MFLSQVLIGFYHVESICFFFIQVLLDRRNFDPIHALNFRFGFGSNIFESVPVSDFWVRVKCPSLFDFDDTITSLNYRKFVVV